jgi:hypothetical protein
VPASQGQAEPEFRPDEYFEILLRIRRDQPRRYAREVSAGQRRRAELYEERKARAAAQAVKAKAA